MLWRDRDGFKIHVEVGQMVIVRYEVDFNGRKPRNLYGLDIVPGTYHRRVPL